MKAQMRAANKSNASYTLILGSDEMAKGIVQCKNMSDGEQCTLPIEKISEGIAKLKESKDLLDLGIIEPSEYEKLKSELTPIIINKKQSLNVNFIILTIHY